MDIKVVLDKNGMVPDRYAKHADAAHLHAQKPTTSFPFEVEGIPQGARSLALAFTDYDSIPVCGFTWIHWRATGGSPSRRTRRTWGRLAWCRARTRPRAVSWEAPTRC